MRRLGIDGCRAGWVAAVFADRDSPAPTFELAASLGELLQPGFARACIDIPIGLADDGVRDCEALARAALKAHKSSVFPIPVRSAVDAPDYPAACAENARVTGKKFPIQTWHILPKVREADALLRSRPALVHDVYECHPELVLQRLNGDEPIVAGKKTEAGRIERIAVLERLLPGAESVLANARQAFRAADVAWDDLIDALALAVMARTAPDSWQRLPDPPPVDGRRLPMVINVPRPMSWHPEDAAPY